jgi:hypothetical protein
VASYRIAQPGSLKRDSINNFGRAEVIKSVFPKFSERLVDVQIDEVMSWTVVIDVLAVTPETRVWAKIEYGAGSTNSTDVVDVADHVDVPVVGDSVRVSFGVESTVIPGEGSPQPFSPMAAKVSCSLSSEVPGFPEHATYFPPFQQVDVSGVIGPVSSQSTPPFAPQAVPARLASYEVVASGGAPAYFLLFDQQAVPVNGDVPVWADAFVNGKASFRFVNPKAFDNSVQWALSTTPNSLTLPGPGVSAAVFAELARRPLGQVVNSIQEISGGLF